MKKYLCAFLAILILFAVISPVCTVSHAETADVSVAKYDWNGDGVVSEGDLTALAGILTGSRAAPSGSRTAHAAGLTELARVLLDIKLHPPGETEVPWEDF